MPTNSPYADDSPCQVRTPQYATRAHENPYRTEVIVLIPAYKPSEVLLEVIRAVLVEDSYERRPALVSSQSDSQGTSFLGWGKAKSEGACLGLQSGPGALSEFRFQFCEDAFLVELACGDQVIEDSGQFVGGGSNGSCVRQVVHAADGHSDE